MRRSLFGLFLAVAAFGQAFEAVSVRPANPVKKEAGGSTIQFTPGRMTVRNLSLMGIVTTAYGLKYYQMKGPEEALRERYDVVGTAAGPAGEDEMRPMLQQLLADRFHLAFHWDKKELPVYVVVAGKKPPKLRDSKEEEPTRIYFEGEKIVFRHVTMVQFLNWVTKMRADLPLIDETGLTGAYDFEATVLEESGDGAKQKANMEKSIADGGMALRVAAQAGFKVETRNLPVEMMVIDRVERPAAN